MVTIYENYEGHKEWKAWSRQEIIAEQGETLHEVVEFMHAHLQHFGKTDLTFEVGDIEHQGNIYYIILKPHNSPPAYVHFSGGNYRVHSGGGLRFKY